MINLQDIRYARLGTYDLAMAQIYATEILGLEFVRKDQGQLYFRSDERDHTLVYFDGDPADQSIGFELSNTTDLDQAGDALSNGGVNVESLQVSQCEQRHVKSGLQFTDLSGNKIDLVVRPEQSGRSFIDTRGVGISGFSHIGLCSLNPIRDEVFWTQILGARVSDRIGDAPLLRIDEVHHRIALFPSNRSGIQHINHQVDSINDVMRAWYALKKLGVKVVFGPGRHPTSGAVFLYFEGPDGMVFEYSTGVRLIKPEQESSHVPRQFARANESFCMWGSIPDIAEFRDAAQ